ncbi:elongation factor Tu GTP binding domain-containing protein [Pavlovales sp. CCMP2436]|nr:elongation factor Tu GTP binding domain-containing protein [Pavlovales sp. CCMP2436]
MTATATTGVAIRNIAIIAHVDHGKTTLMDAVLKESMDERVLAKSFSDMGVDQDVGRLMDSNDQERERGITILAKNAAVNWKGTKVNCVDTPGHADFGGEVERIMKMVDGVLLVVDSVDGPKPQTRFVLRKALDQGHAVVVVINKCDRPTARPEYVMDKTFDLFVELGATDEQCDFRVVYTSAIQGLSGDEFGELKPGMGALLDAVIAHVPAPKVTEQTADEPLQILIANIDYDDFKGKLGIGRITSGRVKQGTQAVLARPGEEPGKKTKIAELFVFDALGRTPVTEASAGEIVVVSGFDNIRIGDTLTDPDTPIPLEPIAIEEPTVRMTFGVNKSPMAGREGKQLTSRVIRDRLMKELDRNVALRVAETDNADTYEVSGRGQLHLSVLVESMRREGFELFVGPPTVIIKEIEGRKCEPFEKVEITVPSDCSGACISALNLRKGDMLNLNAVDTADGRGSTTMEYTIATRALIGLRNQLLTATRGEMVMDTVFDAFKPYLGDINTKEQGSLLAYEAGIASPFGIIGAQDRGRMLIDPKTECYKDMIIGIHQRAGDLTLNVCKTKQLTNMRSAGKDNDAGVVPKIEFSLDACIEYISEDELVEVTPTSIRMLKNPDIARKNGQKKN